MQDVLIIGVGNAYRGDDTVGLLVAEHLSRSLTRGTIRAVSGEGTALMEMWKDAGTVFLIDAVVSGARPGTIHRLEVHTQPVPPELFHFSTHSFGVAEAIEMARVLGQLPARLVVYGIEGQNFDFGTHLSPEVERAAREVAERIAQEAVCMNSR